MSSPGEFFHSLPGVARIHQAAFSGPPVVAAQWICIQFALRLAGMAGMKRSRSADASAPPNPTGANMSSSFKTAL